MLRHSATGCFPNSGFLIDAMTTNELTVDVNGLSLAVKTWGDPASKPLIALHGWLDNAATFERLAALLPDYYWVAPDLPGHGRSQHRGVGVESSIWSYCVEVMALADALGLENFFLLGHSMGGGIANLLAGIFPQRIQQLVLLDIMGVITTPAEQSLDTIRRGLDQRLGKPLRKAGLYSSLDDAITARARKGVSRQAAGLLGARGITQGDEGYYWSHDQRLTRKNLFTMSEEQLAPFLAAITCPVMVITSAEAVVHEEALHRRAAMVSDIRIEHLPGGHHQHLDGDVPAIARLVGDFLAGK